MILIGFGFCSLLYSLNLLGKRRHVRLSLIAKISLVTMSKRSSHMMQSQYYFPSQAAAPALEYVGVGRRFLAVIIDTIILLIIDGIIPLINGMIVSAILSLSGVITAGGDTWIDFICLLQIIIIPFVYHIGMEAMLGATVGKMVLGIRVVKLDGSPISWGEAIVRNLLRFVDLLPSLYLLAVLLIWTSPRRQRLGDHVAHTVVVRRSSSKTLPKF
jgi:uncharacterized RDD family membrane protein YckC